IKHPSLAIHPDKTRFVTTKYGRHVTGLTISLDGRVTAGQYRKRKVRAGVHNFKHGKLDEAACIRLAGLIAFINAVEPGYIDKLKSQHGGELIQRLQSSAI